MDSAHSGRENAHPGIEACICSDLTVDFMPKIEGAEKLI